MSTRNDKDQVTQENTEKVMTKYDRKMQARKEAERREKARERRTRITAIAIALVIAIVAIVVPVTKNINARREYIRVGNHSVNEIEYNFYYGYSVNTFLTNYASILSYMNLDTSVDFASQQFSEDLTWADYFNQMTASNILQYFALADDAAAKGYEYDTDADYDAFYDSMQEAADEEGISLKRYLRAVFGSYASKSNLKDSVTTFLTAQSYYTYLLEQNAPSDEEIAAYYEENKNNYDTVDYNVFGIAAETTDESTEDEITAAMETAQLVAEGFANRYTAGELFSALCTEFATEENAETYADETASLHEDATYSATTALYRDWLFDESRVAGDVTTIVDEDNDIWYVVAFQGRECPETTNDTISSTLASTATQEYVSEISEDYQIVDEKNHLNLSAGSDEDADVEATPTAAPDDESDAETTPSADESEDAAEPTPAE